MSTEEKLGGGGGKYKVAEKQKTTLFRLFCTYFHPLPHALVLLG
jgi:hypothetical protein